MTDNVDNIILEHLKRMQTELSAARERDAEIMTRLSHIETGISRIGRDVAGNYSELIQDRHMVDQIKLRLERIERRLELAD